MSDPVSRTGQAGPDYASFVLRLTQERFRDETDALRLRWRGHIRHVQGEREARFTDFAEAVAFIQAQLAEITMEAASSASEPEREQLLEDGYQLWGRVAEQYADLWGDAMRTTLKRSEVYNRQMTEAIDRSMRAWNPLMPIVPPATSPAPEAVADDAEETRALLEAVRVEIRDLAASVARLESALAAGGGGKGDEDATV